MVTLQGKSAYREICMGRIAFYRRKSYQVKRQEAKDKDAEWQRYVQARQEAGRQLQSLYSDTVKAAGAVTAAVFEIQKLLLEDCEYVQSVHDMIYSQGVNLEYAIWMTGQNMVKMLRAVEDDYIRERDQDIQDITKRLLEVLDGKKKNAGQGGETPWESRFDGEPSIVAADDLMPSETVRLPREKVLGFVMQGGNVNSHTAVLARSMGIPALFDIGASLLEQYDGAMAVIDGYTGTLYIEPDSKTLEVMSRKKEQSDRHRLALLRLRGLENITIDGKRISVFANAGCMEDVEQAWDNDAGGIGLLRSEFLYLGRDSAPDEETQFLFYRQVLERMKGKEVVIRTLDIGADKQAEYLKLGKEENPALGLRAVRLCLKRPQLLKTQLRALYRAGTCGSLSIMYPMITSVEEILELRKIEAQVRKELSEEGIPFEENIKTGIMIETPAAAIISDELAPMVDFFSVGTNDLTQYTLAADRQNGELLSFCNPHHRAVLRLIEFAARNAHRAGIPIGICGELGADTELTEEFIRMGIDELSVAPSMILKLRGRIRELDLSK